MSLYIKSVGKDKIIDSILFSSFISSLTIMYNVFWLYSLPPNFFQLLPIPYPPKYMSPFLKKKNPRSPVCAVHMFSDQQIMIHVPGATLSKQTDSPSPKDYQLLE